MKIDANNNQPLKLNNLKKQEKPTQPVGLQAQDSSSLTVSDKVNLSERSKLIFKASELANQAPDVRADKVADLTARIAAGTYKVGTETVANAIIKKSFSGLI
ncbi:MAG: flagellar biosynthesis anti-sigma factor FlgM [Deltaproteobacteria bacterium]|jgi:negative regulator of flagellin synthesis FlgM|nr:flagellar biosynthesis anti-sigma factor FlgM [Deltaproteobacteria bacterium]